MNENKKKQHFIAKENTIKESRHRDKQSKTITMYPETPLLERLSTYTASDTYPFHMPGHKRQIRMGITSFPNPFSVDITEIDGFDNLHHAENILKDSMKTAASVYGADRSWYLVNGSTCGILTVISAAVKPGGKILIARNSHKSAYHAVVLNQLEPVYLYPEKVPDFCIPGGIRPNQVEKALSDNSDIRTVFVTSPTYEGIVSDIREIAKTAHRHGAVLIVDEAHGAHLPFGDGNYFPKGALQEGADLVIQSLHKTLPSLTQTAILHLKSQILDAKKVEQYLSVYQSSSPSYIMIASAENCVRYMAEKGTLEMEEYAGRLSKLRENLSKLKHFRLMTRKICGEAGVNGYDPSKLVIFPLEMTGKELSEILRRKYHLEAEMSTGQYVLLMTSFMDTNAGFARLEQALLELDESLEMSDDKKICSKKESRKKAEQESIYSIKQSKQREERKSISPIEQSKQGEEQESISSVEQSKQKAGQESYSEKFPHQKCLPWQAWHSDGVLVPLDEAKGRITRTCVTIYPPGVPMLMPGEQIGEWEISQIRDAWRLGLTVEGICEKPDISNLWIEVVI